MGGWSGGVYTRFRNWVTDKANSINPQASLFDQEDDGFAAGLNNCVTKDGLNKPTAAMDWNGQNLTGILNLANTGTLSLVSGKLTMSLNGNIVASAPTSGNLLQLGGVAGSLSLIASQAIEVSANGIPQYIMNSLGANFGYIQNDTTGTWSLAYGTTIGTLGTPVIQWNSSNGALARDDGGTMQAIGWRDVPINSQTANYTLALSDRGKYVINNKPAATMNLVIPANATVAFPLGSAITGYNNISGQNISVQRAGGVSLFLAGDSTFVNADRTVAPGGQFNLILVSANSWVISGVGVS